jgi:hypothetical protein
MNDEAKALLLLLGALGILLGCLAIGGVKVLEILGRMH